MNSGLRQLPPRSTMAILSQLLLSDDKLAENNDDTHTQLLERHPAAAKTDYRNLHHHPQKPVSKYWNKKLSTP